MVTEPNQKQILKAIETALAENRGLKMENLDMRKRIKKLKKIKKKLSKQR